MFLDANDRVENPVPVVKRHAVIRASLHVDVAAFDSLIIDIDIFRADRAESSRAHGREDSLAASVDDVTLRNE